MNRRQFLTSAATVGVGAALPAIPTDIPYTIPSTNLTPHQLLNLLFDLVVKTEEYQQAQWDLMVYGRSTFDSTKALQQAGLIP